MKATAAGCSAWRLAYDSQPDPHLATLVNARFEEALPPNHIGIGCWVGFGSKATWENPTCSPWYSATSSVHRAIIASTYSSTTWLRWAKSIPRRSNSSLTYPVNSIGTQRPPDIQSMVAMAFARWIGGSHGSTTSGQTVNRRVAPKNRADDARACGHRGPMLSVHAPCGRAMCQGTNR